MPTTRTRRRGRNSRSSFSRSVFINCPFDDAYKPLLRPALFTIVYLGFNPRIALESQNSGIPRLDKIIRMIAESKYAIHDLSRLLATTTGEFFRLNMPFELGLDVGCRRYSSGTRKTKRILILEAERFRYRAALSDIAGLDIESHDSEPRNIVVVVRHWLCNESGVECAGPAKIWASFNEFMSDNSGALRRNGFLKKDIEKLPVGELLQRMENWCAAHRR